MTFPRPGPYRVAITLMALLAAPTHAPAQCQLTRLVAPDSDVSSYSFGSVALSDALAVAGWPGRPNDADGSPDAGAVYIYLRNGLATPTLEAMVADPDARSGDLFGTSVAAEGTTVVVGAPQAGTDQTGAAFIFQRMSIPFDPPIIFYQQTARLATPIPTPFARFGTAVAIDHGTIAVGTLFEDAVYVYVRAGTGWTLQQRLAPPAGSPSGVRSFGVSVAIDGDRLLVGAQGFTVLGPAPRGQAYVFRRVGVLWSLEQTLDPGVATADSAQFGRSVALRGDTAIVGAPLDAGGAGAAYAFRRTGTAWSAAFRLPSSAFRSEIGRSLAYEAGLALVGSQNMTFPSPSGAINKYRRVGAGWVPDGMIVPADPNQNRFSEFSIAVRNGVAMVGDDGFRPAAALTNVGAAYLFTLPGAADSCFDAAPLALGTVAGCTDGATLDGVSGCAPGSLAPDVWYAFTAETDGAYEFNTDGSLLDTVLSLHTPDCAPGPSLACDDQGGSTPNASRLTRTLVRGSTVLVRVGGYGSARGPYLLTARLITPSNDACASATPITRGVYTFTSGGATTAGPAEPCIVFPGSQIENDVWFRYTAPCAGATLVSTCGSNFDTRLAVYGAACPSAPGTAIACGDDSCGEEARLRFAAAVSGRQYLIRVGGVGGGLGVLLVRPAADVDGNGEVNANDISAYLNGWYADVVGGGTGFDFDLSGETNANDVSLFLNDWYAQATGGC